MTTRSGWIDERALVLQHADAEGPASIGDALVAAGVELEVCRAHAGDPVPFDADGLDALVVMGGPQAAYRDDRFPTRLAELDLLRSALLRAVPTLAVCLGAQLLAEAAGGRSYRGDGYEIGWGPVELDADTAADDPLFAGVAPSFEALHWHGDTFDLPPEAVRLAGNDRYANQAARFGPRAWAVQFHLEVDEPAVHAFVAAWKGDPAIASEAPAKVAAMAPVRDQVLARFAALVG